MQQISLVAAAIFLPLFPLSMLFNAVFQRTRLASLRALLLLAWPLAGIAVLQVSNAAVPAWLAPWALFSAALYGFRAVVIREVGVWTGFLATSAWALLWVAVTIGFQPRALVIHALAFSLPLVLLVFMTAELERRYESAYAGIVSGIAQAQPRLAGVFVVTILAVIGSPMFPSFFTLLSSVTLAAALQPVVAFGIAAVWLLWSWSGVRLLQQLLVGPGTLSPHEDIAHGMTMAYGLSLLLLLFSGLYVLGMVS